jgi:hypothetical protein
MGGQKLELPWFPSRPKQVFFLPHWDQGQLGAELKAQGVRDKPGEMGSLQGDLLKDVTLSPENPVTGS